MQIKMIKSTYTLSERHVDGFNTAIQRVGFSRDRYINRILDNVFDNWENNGELASGLDWFRYLYSKQSDQEQAKRTRLNINLDEANHHRLIRLCRHLAVPRDLFLTNLFRQETKRLALIDSIQKLSAKQLPFAIQYIAILTSHIERNS